jgi:hypothetical protein
MSMNLALVKGKHCIYDQIYQTPSVVSKAAMASGDPTQYYKNWVLESRKGAFPEATKENFEFIDRKIAEGYQWQII